MTIEVRPLGDRCNIQCRYCYQDTMRRQGVLPKQYSMDRIMESLARFDEPFAVFGGEALMVRDDDLERLFAYGHERYGECAVQSNGTLIDRSHIEMFKRYNVRVGISIDGPGPLNDARWAGSPAATRRATHRTEAVIVRLCREGHRPSIIVTLHRHNAAADRLPVLLAWTRYLDSLGIRKVRLHLLQSDDPEVERDLTLTPEENKAALRAFLALEPSLRHVRFDLFDDMRKMLAGEDDLVSCVWQACDPLSTRAVRGIEGDGQRSNCGRTKSAGIGYVSADVPGFERQLALYRTSQDEGGCRDCRFFLMCKGNCPGTALGGDWRFRSEHCAVWFGLYEDLEAAMAAAGEEPLSLSSERSAIEAELTRQWECGVDESLASVRRRLASAG